MCEPSLTNMSKVEEYDWLSMDWVQVWLGGPPKNTSGWFQRNGRNFLKNKIIIRYWYFLFLYWFLKTNSDVMGMWLVLGLHELCKKCLMPSSYVEFCGWSLFFCTVVKALKAIRNKEVVKRISKVLCAFEA